MADDLCAARAQWTPAEPAGLGVDLLESRVAGRRSRDGGVGRNNTGKLARADEFEDFVERLESEVGRNLDENGLGLRNLSGLCLLSVDLLERSVVNDNYSFRIATTGLAN